MNGFSKLNVICPSYFSLFNNCQKENIKIIKHKINYISGDFLEINPIKYNNGIFWLTNPIYSLGLHINVNNLGIIEQLLENNIVIADDCVAHKYKEISRVYGNHKNFIGIYAPHKSVCINGIKFSAIVFNKENESFFDQSIDFLCGGLNIASVAAIVNYLDGSYEIYRNKFQEYINETHLFIKNICKDIPQLYYSNTDEHYLTSICFPNIPYELSGDLKFLWNIMDHTGAAFITGYFNNYPQESGFSFRVNMARDSVLFRSTLKRLLLFLAQI
jgi:bifunctional pyridoxal-dependent enzyme with beta-cystathionase and maltose regulon repressor activities